MENLSPFVLLFFSSHHILETCLFVIKFAQLAMFQTQQLQQRSQAISIYLMDCFVAWMFHDFISYLIWLHSDRKPVA